jgi:hypothetical protein
METDPASEMLRFLAFRMPDDGQSKNPIILRILEDALK